MASQQNDFGPVQRDDMYFENNRWYCKLGRGKYEFPCDENEKNALDIFHRFFMELRKILHAFELPAGEKHNILDLGTGTGIWAIDMAMQYENACIDGVDLVLIQPEKIYSNQEFHVMDIEGEWKEIKKSYHLIFARQLYGIQDWSWVYQNSFHCLKPGGYLEQVQVDIMPRCDDGTVPHDWVIANWAVQVTAAMKDAGRPMTIDPKQVEVLMKAAGLVDFGHQVIPVRYSSWGERTRDGEIGRWFNLAMHESIHGLTVGPLTRKGLSYEQANCLVDAVKKEMTKTTRHAYCYVHIYTGRRP